MKKLLLLSVLGLFACSKVETPKSYQTFAKVKIHNSFIESQKGIYDTMRIQIDCVGEFTKEGTTEFIFIIPQGEYTPCYDVDFTMSTYNKTNVPYRIIGRNDVVKSGVIKFDSIQVLNVII